MTRLLRIRDLPIADPSDAIVADVVLPRSTCMVWGAANAGKSTIVYDLAVSVACGAAWAGRATRKGAVLILAYEGQRALRARLEAAAAARGVDASTLDVFVVREPPNLADAVGLRELRGISRDLDCRLIMLDTLTAACGGALDLDSGAGGDAPRIVEAMRSIIPPDGSLLAVHHSGWAPGRMRGSSILRAALDTELEAAEGVLRTRKQRDLASDFAVGYRLEPMHGAVVVTYGEPPDNCAAGNAALKQQVAAAIAASPDATANEIAKAVGGRRKAVLALVAEIRGVVPEGRRRNHSGTTRRPSPCSAREPVPVRRNQAGTTLGTSSVCPSGSGGTGGSPSIGREPEPPLRNHAERSA